MYGSEVDPVYWERFMVECVRMYVCVCTRLRSKVDSMYIRRNQSVLIDELNEKLGKLNGERQFL